MNHTIRVAFCGVLAGLGLALMFLTALLPMATFALPALAGLLMIMIVIEMGARWAWPTFAVVAVLSGIRCCGQTSGSALCDILRLLPHFESID